MQPVAWPRPPMSGHHHTSHTTRPLPQRHLLPPPACLPPGALMSRDPASFWAPPRPRVSPLPCSGGPAWPSSWPDNHTLLPPLCAFSGPDCGQIQQLQSLRSLNTQFLGCKLPKMCHPTTLPMALQVLLRKGRAMPGQVVLFSAHCCGKATSQSCQGPIMRNPPGTRSQAHQDPKLFRVVIYITTMFKI